MCALRADSSSGRGGLKRLLSPGAIGVLSLALVLPVVGRCLCAPSSTSAPECCPSKRGSNVAISTDSRCLTQAAKPAAAEQAIGTLQPPVVAVTAASAILGAPIRAVGRPTNAPLRAASPPLPNLRI
jgi:hypothetical protein